MRTTIGVLLGVLLSAGVAGEAAAQRAEVLLGGGATFSGADVSTVNGHAMLGAVARVTPRFGVRLDALYTPTDTDDLLGIGANAVGSIGTAGARVSPYLLGGGGVFFSGGQTHGAATAGLGLRVAAGERVGWFIEGRYFRVFDVVNDDLIYVTGGLSIALP
ncbi:MAG: hypothetical protein ACREOF_15935 [Gemmatimonadales bacterium]